MKTPLLKTVEQSTPEPIVVIDGEKENPSTMPISRVTCPKCSNREAFWWMVQTRGADESTTQFFRCTRCKHTWRETT